MIRSITRPKREEEIDRMLADRNRIFIIGCGTCVTLCRTGGEPEVRDMKERLSRKGKLVTGTLLLPVACDNLTEEALRFHHGPLSQAEALLIMTCAFGVQTVARQTLLPVIPALDTLFIGQEQGPGLFDETCTQCGDCLLGLTGGICPVTSCHKGLVNGPCGGTNNGKCEIDPRKDCAWTLIYNRLKEQDRLHLMKRYQGPRAHQSEPKPGKFFIPEERS